MTTLFIDCCIRGEKSATRRFAEAWIAKNIKGEAETLRLAEENILPLNAERLKLRDELLAQGKIYHEMFSYAWQFKKADEIVIAAPFWDLSFPALLKIYFENISVCGITFGYEGAQSVGYSRANKVHYFSTCGGFAGKNNEGARYVKAICEMFGVKEFDAHIIDGMDIDYTKREEILTEAIAKL